MCRWIAYVGEPVFVEDFVCVPCQSLIAQSMRSREAHSEMNADGFGLGWYGERSTPGVFRDIRPAWSDENLKSLAHQIRAPLYFAHVRASTGTATTRANCHPFSHGRHMFMHNGQIGGFDRIKRRIEGLIPDDLYIHRSGATDSEALFLALMGRGFGGGIVAAVAALLNEVVALMRQAGIAEPLRFTAALTDGRDVHAFRWASDDRAPSLYWREDGGDLVIVSEPLDDARGQWREVPKGCAVVARHGRPVEMACLNAAMQAAA